jgi:translation initiation factor 1
MPRPKASGPGLVYSTDHGSMCPACNQPVARCRCRRQSAPSPPGDGIVRVGRSTAGRKGHLATVITGVPLPDEALQQLAQQLKQRCGTGGSAKDGVITLQGDHRDVIVQELQRHGYTVKRSGA